MKKYIIVFFILFPSLLNATNFICTKGSFPSKVNHTVPQYNIPLLALAGASYSVDTVNGLFWADLSSIPANSTITSALFKIYLYSPGSGNGTWTVSYILS